MYVPSKHLQDDPAALHALIDTAPFATIVTVADGRPAASHVPMLLDPARGSSGSLLFHLARANPQWRSMSDGSEALAMFVGPDAYISPSWYSSKREHGKVVPTWNYTTVHATGPVRLIHDPAELRELVARLTTRHETGRSDPWAIDDAPPTYIDAQLGAIVGVELSIETLRGRWKLGQTTALADIEGAIAGLEASREPSAVATAAAMRLACPGNPSPGRQ